jgi:gluconolactonase
MFAAPPELPTKVFTRLPDHLEWGDRRSAWVERKRPGSRFDSFLEGPSFDREGHLYTVDLAHGRIFRISPAGEWTVVCEYDGEPNGLKIRKDGAIFCADQKNGIVQIDPGTGAVSVVLGELPRGPLKGPNDLWFANNGDLYFTDQGETGLQDPSGRVVRIRANGKVDVLLDNVPGPNGIVGNKQQTALFVAATRSLTVWAVPIPTADMPVQKAQAFVQLSGGLSSGPDGLVLDEEENLVVCHCGLGSVWVFDPFGEPLYRIRSCVGRLTTNAAFGGPDRKTLYVTESQSGSILVAEWQTPGRPMYSHT